MTETAREVYLTITRDGVILSRNHKICTIAPGEQVTLNSEEYTFIVYRKLKPAPLAKVKQFRPRRVQP